MEEFLFITPFILSDMNKKTLVITIVAIIVLASVVGVLYFIDWGNEDTIYDHFFQAEDNQMFYQSSFAIDDNGNLYIGTSHKQYWQIEGNEWSEHYYLYSFYPNNTERWKFATNNSEIIKGGPAIHPEGLVIFVTEAMSSIYDSLPNSTFNKVYALNLDDGTLNWSSPKLSSNINDGPWGANGLNPAVDWNGHIYVQSQDNITSFYKNGTIKWYNDSLSVSFDSAGSPTIYNDTVYFPSGGDSKISISAFYTNGTYKWHYEIDSDDCFRFNMITIDDDGLLYAGTDGNDFYIINSDGTTNKTYEIPTSNAKVRGNVAIDSDGTLYLGTKNDQNSEFYALDTSGTEVSVKWKYNSPLRDVYSSPTIANDGSIFFATEDRKVFRVNKQNGNLINSYEVERDITWCSCTFDNDGTLYIGDMGGFLYSIELGNIGLADTPWPCLGASFKRTRYQSPA